MCVEVEDLAAMWKSINGGGGGGAREYTST